MILFRGRSNASQLALVIAMCLLGPRRGGAQTPADPATPAPAEDAAPGDPGSAAPGEGAAPGDAGVTAPPENPDGDDADLEALRREAEAAAAAPAPAESGASSPGRPFVTSARSLQMFNPEVSVSGDALATVLVDEDGYVTAHDRSGVALRGLGLHFQSSLDPYSFTKASIHFSPEHGAGLEELYLTWSAVVPSVSLTVGRFRQLFGAVNRWHVHALDQTAFPLALTTLFGGEGLGGTGMSLRWLMPRIAPVVNELTLEVTNGENEEVFAGEFFSVPSTLAHLKSYHDLSDSTYVELGLTGMVGFNNRRGVPDPVDETRLVDEPWRTSILGGADLTVFWQPINRSKYRSLTWRSEGFWLRKETDADTEQGWGAYSYLQHQLDARWYLGVRGDVVSPLGGGDAPLTWQAVPYVTYWQSEFVYLRLEARHGDNFAYGRDSRVLLQVDFAAGPHKHEKY